MEDKKMKEGCMAYWCCKAEFGEHEASCKNYVAKHDYRRNENILSEALAKVANSEYCMVSGCNKNKAVNDCLECNGNVAKKALSEVGRCEHGKRLCEGCNFCRTIGNIHTVNELDSEE
jgi:hypothetical protein